MFPFSFFPKAYILYSGGGFTFSTDSIIPRGSKYNTLYDFHIWPVSVGHV